MDWTLTGLKSGKPSASHPQPIPETPDIWLLYHLSGKTRGEDLVATF